MKSTILSTFLINVVFARQFHHHISHHHHVANILKYKEKFFNETSETVQNITNELFDAMHLTDTFFDSAKVKLLLTMFYDLNNIAATDVDFYEKMINLTNSEPNNKPINIIQLDEAVRDTVNEYQSKVFLKMKRKNRKKTISQPISWAVSNLTTQMSPLLGLKDGQEFKQFIAKFVEKIRSLTVDDLFQKKSKSTNATRISRTSLPVWKPPSNLKEWYINKTIDNRRVYRGHKTNIENFPFVVSIHILQNFMCGGSIIQRDLVITASSCMQIHYNNRFFRENPKTTFVRVGSDWANRRGELIKVLEIFFYPSYEPKTLKHNIALLRLSRAIKFETRRRTKVRKIYIDHFDGHLAYNTREIVLLGWGATKANQIVNTFEKLQVTFLQVYPLEECRDIYSSDYVAEKNFCAGYMSQGSGACNRDVGSPGVVGGQLVGIVSFGPPVCGSPNAPTVFTRVGSYLDWIETVMQSPPPRYGAPRSTRMTSRAFIYYYNTITSRTLPRLKPIYKEKNKLQTKCMRAHDNFMPETTALNAFIPSSGGVTNQAFTDNYYVPLKKNNYAERLNDQPNPIPGFELSDPYEATAFKGVMRQNIVTAPTQTIEQPHIYPAFPIEELNTNLVYSQMGTVASSSIFTKGFFDEIGSRNLYLQNFRDPTHEQIHNHNAIRQPDDTRSPAILDLSRKNNNNAIRQPVVTGDAAILDLSQKHNRNAIRQPVDTEDPALLDLSHIIVDETYSQDGLFEKP